MNVNIMFKICQNIYYSLALTENIRYNVSAYIC